MISLLCKIFVKNNEDTQNPTVRRAYGTMVSAVGILLNILLSAIKLIAGVLSGAIAITADALNNLSDALSQIISLISFKISSKPADRDHPFGHARMEYVASMIVSFLILLVGFELFSASLDKVFHPTKTTFSILVTVILGISVLIKLWIALLNFKIARRIQSSVMRATATDSLSDAVSTSAVLISMLIAHFTGFETDAYMGMLVSVLIFVAGIRILSETKNLILGTPPDPEVLQKIVEITKKYDGVLGIHDMVVHNYGPGNTIASLHAEVDGSENVFVTHDMIDNLEKELFSRLGVRATVHMDPIVTDDERVNALRATTQKAIKALDECLNIHDFRFVEGTTHSNLIFDVSVPFEYKESDEELRRRISNTISQIDPNYFVVLTIDRE